MRKRLTSMTLPTIGDMGFRKRITAKTLDDDITAEKSIMADLITFGNRAYPRDGQVLLVAGGAGSGKGFVIDNLIGLEGRRIDVDKFKELAVGKKEHLGKTTKDIIQKLLERKLGKDNVPDLSEFNLKNPKDVERLHGLLSRAGLKNMINKTLEPIKELKNKPNLIFDKTLSERSDIEKTVRQAIDLGYDRKNIHLVWVLNEIKTAIENNKSRSRTVPQEILEETHKGVSRTMSELKSLGNSLGSLIGGDIWIVFNKNEVDMKFRWSGDKENDPLHNNLMDKNGIRHTFEIKGSHCIKIKEKGKDVDLSKFEQKYTKELAQTVLERIAEYTGDSGWLK